MYKMVVGIFNYLEKELPRGWIAKLDKQSDSIDVLGPDDAVIYIRANKKDRTSVTGKWPQSFCGKKMDPYEWGVLSLNDDYPFMRLSVLQSTESKIHNILKYITKYKPIYNECMGRLRG